MKSYESGNQQVAKEGGDVAKAARNQLEATIGESAKVPKVPEQKFNSKKRLRSLFGDPHNQLLFRIDKMNIFSFFMSNFFSALKFVDLPFTSINNSLVLFL